MGTQPSRVPVVGSPYEQDPAWADPSLTHRRALWLGLLLTRQCLSTYEAHNLKNIRGSQAVRDESSEASGHRYVGSRVLHALDRWATKPTLALSVVTAVVVWVLYSAVFGFPARLETIFQTLAAATTLAMVFVIQHTQARAQAATQRKLDEILLASPEADNTLITLEEAPDNELKEATDAHRDARRDASQESPS